MSGKALITLLLVGSSSAALARPASGHFQRATVVTRDHRAAPRVERNAARGRDRIRVDRRWDQARLRGRTGRFERFDRDRGRWRPRIVVQPAPSYTPSYAPIYTPSYAPSYAYGIAPSGVALLAPTTLAGDGRLYIAGGDASLTTLQLSATSGDTRVDQVIVEYADGATQVIPVHQELAIESPSITLGLDRRDPVARIVLYGQSEYGGQLAMTGF